jgi:DNA-directed RNA polymerase subunit beta'
MSNLTLDFDHIKINLASPESIREWGTRVSQKGFIVGQVTEPLTINLRTFKPEMNGLFCEKIFGPVKNWECNCGKYQRLELNDLIICARCNVEITESIVRRYRMGFINLFSPVTHIWYLKGRPSYLSLLLNIKLQALEETVYFNDYLDLKFQNLLDITLITELFESLLSVREPKIGAEAIQNLLNQLNLSKEIDSSRSKLPLVNGETRIKVIRRIRLIENFLATGSEPKWMILSSIPVIPPSLRPMMQLDGGRFASSDLNEFYLRIITRNNRLKELIKMRVSTTIIHNEQRLLQEAIDNLIDNGKHGCIEVGMNNREYNKR